MGRLKFEFQSDLKHCAFLQYGQTANIDLSRTDLIAFRFLKEIKKESFLRLVGCVTKPFGKTSVKLAHNDHDNNKKTVFFQ